ncbi:MAG: hypothetical protein OEY64_13165 [Nitrospinota bacterium]|nr:hypothetical protein [Nitrospinota bacterium]
MENKNNKPDLYAYMVTGSDKKPFFTKIGAAWKNKKGGYGIRLEAHPVGGEIVLFPPREKNETVETE